MDIAETEGTWLTYAELGARLGVSPNEARMVAVRRGWQRRAFNRIGVAARVLVLPGAETRDRAIHDVAPSNARPNGEVRASDHYTRAVEQAIAVLAGQLEHERTRANDAVAAERIAAGEATAIRHQLDRMREWGLLRRLRWALRPR
jgi:hypothetical protein